MQYFLKQGLVSTKNVLTLLKNNHYNKATANWKGGTAGVTEKQKKPFWHRNSLLINVLGPCFIIAVLMMALSLVEYRYAYDIARENAIETQRSILQGAADQLDTAIYSMETLVDTVNRSKAINEKLKVSNASGNAYDISQTIAALPDLMTDGKLIGEYHIFMRKTGEMYAPRRGTTEPWRYYGSYFGDDDRTYEQWMQDTFENTAYGMVLPAQDAMVEEFQEKVLFYILPYMDFSTATHRGDFLFYIYNSGVRELMSPSFAAGAQLVYLTGADGQLLTWFGGDEKLTGTIDDYLLDGASALWKPQNRTVHGNRLLYSQVQMEFGGVTITVVTPVEVFERQVVHTMSVMIMLILGTMLAVALVMGHYILSNQQPLAQLSDNLGARAPGGKAAFIRLNEAFFQIRGDYDQQSMELKKHRDALLEALVSEKRIDNQVYSLLSEHIENPYGTDVFFRGVYMRISGLETMDADKLMDIIARAVENSEMSLKVLSRRNDRTLALMYLTDTEQTDSLCEQLTRLHEALHMSCGIRCRFWVGPVSRNLQQLCYSFSGAWRLAEHTDPADERLVLVAAENSLPQYFQLRDSDENKLIAHCQEGDEVGVVKCLNEIYQDNFVRRELSVSIRTLLYARLNDALVKCAGDTAPAVAEIEKLLHLPPQEAFAWLQERFCLAARENMRRRNDDAQELNRQIIEHIQLNFRDPELCLTSIASVFGMTESYLSVLIKHTLNQNYSTYLNDLRIRYASGLLAEGRYTVEQIAEMSGYTNAASFRRAYKRTTGYAPSAHADHAKSEDE